MYKSVRAYLEAGGAVAVGEPVGRPGVVVAVDDDVVLARRGGAW